MMKSTIIDQTVIGGLRGLFDEPVAAQRFLNDLIKTYLAAGSETLAELRLTLTRNDKGVLRPSLGRVRCLFLSLLGRCARFESGAIFRRCKPEDCRKCRSRRHCEGFSPKQPSPRGKARKCVGLQSCEGCFACRLAMTPSRTLQSFSRDLSHCYGALAGPIFWLDSESPLSMQTPRRKFGSLRGTSIGLRRHDRAAPHLIPHTARFAKTSLNTGIAEKTFGHPA